MLHLSEDGRRWMARGRRGHDITRWSLAGKDLPLDFVPCLFLAQGVTLLFRKNARPGPHRGLTPPSEMKMTT